MTDPIAEVRRVLQLFQDGYLARDVTQLDDFMGLFVPGDDIELIGIGASARNQNEWFQGPQRIREIVESDWRYWGDVRLDVADAKITVLGDAAWLSTTGAILQTDHIRSDEVTGFFVTSMKELLDRETLSPGSKLMEATHYGLRRLRERAIPAGYRWPFVFTAVLMRLDETWRFHTIHWAMPVD